MRYGAALLSLVTLVGPAIALAQPSEVPEPELAEPEPDPAVRASYDAAFDALVQGRLAEAAAGFDGVAGGGGELAASARELARLARQLQTRGVRFVVPEPPARTAPRAPAEPVASARVAADDRPESGRIGFVAATTVASVYTSITLIDLLDVEDFRAGTLMVAGVTGAGFTVSLLATRERDVSAGVADSYSTGLLLGAANGLLLASPLGLDDQSEQVLGAGLGGMVLGGTTGFLLADHTRPTVAQSSLVTTLSFLGIASSGLGTAIAAPEDLDGDTLLLLLAGGLDLGAAAGIALAPRIDWSKGRARLVGLGSFLGGLGGLGLAALIVGEPSSDDEGRLLAATTLGGLWAGFGLSVRLTRDMAPDPRFARSEPDRLQVTPTMLQHTPGLALSGTF